MKRPSFSSFRSAGAMTLIELMISTAIVALTGGIIFTILNTGLVLFAKNTAINVAHEQAREAVVRILGDIHEAVSVPQFVNGSLVSYGSSFGTHAGDVAEGVSFQVFGGTPGEYFKVANNTAQGDATLNITGSNWTPVVGQRLIVPSYQLESDITQVSRSGTGRSAVYTLTLATTIPAITVSQSGTSYDIYCFVTDRITYLVAPNTGTSPQSYSLYYYPRGNATRFVLTSDISAAKPFTVPLTPSGAPYNKFVAAINLSTSDHTTNNRGYQATNLFINSKVPTRARMTIYQ